MEDIDSINRKSISGKNKKIIVALFSVLIICAILVGSYYLFFSSKEKTDGNQSAKQKEISKSQTEQVHVITVNVLRSVPETVYGQGLLNRVASDSFVRGNIFQQSVINSGVGSLRWPGAGHDNIPIFHFDNKHTVYFDEVPYSTKNPGNIWDTNYDITDAAPPTELVTLSGFVDVLKKTSTTPLLVFTWRSPELWRVINGEKVFYRDPAPRKLDGSAMSSNDAAKLSSQEMQFLENRLMLKEYFDNGGPKNPVVQIGEELWAGWEDTQEPWAEPEINPQGYSQTEWISKTIKLYFEDLEEFAREKNYPVKFAIQFKESTNSGEIIPLPSNSIQALHSDFDVLLENTGNKISYMTASMHYRGTWEQWLQQPEMQMAFMTDNGKGSLVEVNDWFKKYVATKGFSEIDFIPHANSIGDVPKGETLPLDWQKGLMASQYLIESIKA